ncbi:RHS repeat-associated core domain-containing protein [Desnuesiella massiliensis]|uniref:RHS repeat-associated core domain-containing protein n=1 Tax=Desnuesiella massiliensis TaxID=1650662 RepID=UPI0006E33F09|nr:RHS repeat-associated core domain-containing protein [Desnuesiella massiliensis]
MNLNGTEYFYLRNAQGDIIGLIDRDGIRVVSYAYDSWGKPIVTDAEKNDANDTIKDGITGSLANTVGVKNPYRYRGYRYDAETSLYYLQSRYYNPEWGRFLNADGIFGKTGDLLGHNLFAYCENNAINASDPTGFMVTYADVGGTSYFVYMPSSDVSEPVSKASTTHRILDSFTNALGSNKGNALGGIGDSGIAQGIDRIVSKITKPIDYLFSKPKIAYAKGFAGKVGVLNSISFGLSVRDNILHYNAWDAVGRSVIDGIGFSATIGFAIWTAPIWAPTATGFIVGTAAAVGVGFLVNKISGFGKDALFGSKKYD